MDTKPPLDDAPPPSYDSIQHAGAPSQGPSAHSESVTRHLQNHVASLPGRIRASQRALTAQQELDDTLLIDYVAPAIEGFLADLGAQGAAVTPLATLTIVPGGAVPPKAELSGLEEMQKRGELARVFRVSLAAAADDDDGAKEKSKKDARRSSSSSSYSYDFTFSSSSLPGNHDKNTANLLWWRDEAMARRLAASLQPRKTAATGKEKKQRPAAAERKSAVQAAVEKEIPTEKQKRGWGIGKWRSGRGSPQSAGERAVATDTDNTTTTTTSLQISGMRLGAQRQEEDQVQEEQDGAQMMVEAQEVAFRVENDFGILESTRGWAIVVTVKVN